MNNIVLLPALVVIIRIILRYSYLMTSTGQSAAACSIKSS